MYDGDTFTHNGRTFRFETQLDDDMGPPWKEHDGHGEVSEWTSRDKTPWELVLSEGRGLYRYYNFDSSMAIAKRDGWGLGHEMTDAEIRQAISTLQKIAEDEAVEAEENGDDPPAPFDPADLEAIKLAIAVERDFQHLKAWCDDDWQWVGVVVTHIKTDEHGDEVDGDSESLWGIESDAGDEYFDEVARELADEINAQLDEDQAREIAASRPDLVLVEG